MLWTSGGVFCYVLLFCFPFSCFVRLPANICVFLVSSPTLCAVAMPAIVVARHVLLCVVVAVANVLRALLGNNCQTNIDDCAGRPCGGHGSCIDGMNSYTCVCNPPFTGESRRQLIPYFVLFWFCFMFSLFGLLKNVVGCCGILMLLL